MTLTYLAFWLCLLQFLSLWQTESINILETPTGDFLCMISFLYAVKLEIQTLCSSFADKCVLCSLLFVSLTTCWTSCFFCLLNFCLTLTSELCEPGAVTRTCHCHCQSLNLGSESMPVTKCKNKQTNKEKNPNNPHMPFIRSDLTLR